MKDYIIFKGVHSGVMGVRMTQLPRDTRAPVRKIETKVPGRHGSLRTTESALPLVNTNNGQNYRPVFDTYTESFECVLLPCADPDKVKEWLTGEGDLVTSSRPDRRQRISVDDAMQSEIIVRGRKHRRIRIAATFQPLKYEKEPSHLRLYAADWIQNPGNVESEPVITVQGTGDFVLYVNGEALLLSGIDESITLDSEMGDAYSDSGLQNAKIVGDLPVFLPGKNKITWDGKILWLDIRPNWRWL